MKKLFEKLFEKNFEKISNSCKNPSENTDIYSEGRDSDMITYDELMKKSVSELRAMLADDTLFPLENDNSNDTIELICDVILKKEKAPAFFRKLSDKLSWRRFKKAYIANDSENSLFEKEVPTSRKPPVLGKVFAAVAAAAVIVIAVNVNIENTPELEESIMPMYTFEIKPEQDRGYSKPSAYALGIDGLPGNFKVTAQGDIIYDDNSMKKYTIYSSSDDMFFISILSNFSDTPVSENEKDIFDIFAHANIDDTNIKDGGERLRTFDINGVKAVIYGDLSYDTTDGIAVIVVNNPPDGEIGSVYVNTYVTKLEKEP
jgi:hypothetical protein